MKYAIKNVFTAAYSNGLTLIQKCDIAIEGDRITAVGQIPEGFVPDRVIDGSEKFAIPGLINAHTHSYMTLLKNYADDLPFEEWLFQRIMPKEDMMSSEDGYHGALLACCEMLKTGTTCFLDMHMFPGQVAQAALDCGIRAVLSRGLVGDEDEGAKRRLDEALSEMEQYRDEKLLTFKLAPHAIYTCGEKLLKKARDQARDLGIGLHMHISETRKEYDDCIAAHGCSPVQYLKRIGLFEVPVVAVHCVYLDAADIQTLAETGASVATCPISNLKLANGVAPVPAMLDAGINVCLGTDGSSSNNALNMFRELNVLSVLHKGITHDPQSVSAAHGFEMATHAGGVALGFGDQLGRIACGALADLVLIDLCRPEFTPRNDLIASLCYGASGGGVDTVFVGGELVLENGCLTKMDETEIYRKAAESANRLGL